MNTRATHMLVVANRKILIPTVPMFITRGIPHRSGVIPNLRYNRSQRLQWQVHISNGDTVYFQQASIAPLVRLRRTTPQTKRNGNGTKANGNLEISGNVHLVKTRTR